MSSNDKIPVHLSSSFCYSIKCMRLSEKYIKNEMGMFMANYAACILLSAWFLDWRNRLLGSTVGITLGLGMISGMRCQSVHRYWGSSLLCLRS